MYQLIVRAQTWPVAGSFRISHGSVTEVQVVNVEISSGNHTGRGECRPYARYNETPDSVTAQIETIRTDIESELAPETLQALLPAGAARNAVDCALWDLRAKQKNMRIWELLNIPKPRPRTTAYTLSIDSPANMAKAARAAAPYPVLKLKIGGADGLVACLAVLKARPGAQIIIDANEALAPDELSVFRRKLSKAPVLLIEQPLKTAHYHKIGGKPHDLPVLCADESLHTREDLTILWDAGYRAINVKLDKCGGLTEGLALMKQAKSMGFLIMAGCMVGTSLAMAPMMILESYADFIDLDGPLLLAKDMKNGLKFEGPIVHPPKAVVWG